MLRLTGGVFRGRMIHTPPDQGTRPTQAKLRQALFNSLQAHLNEARVLDLFAGSGSLGFEALSWGAAHAVFVESARPAIQALSKNQKLLQVEESTRILSQSISDAVSQIVRLGPFDLIFADPPYAENWETWLLEKFPWQEVLKPGGHFCLEWGTVKSQVSELPDEHPFLTKVREKKYGDSMLTTYQRRTES